MFVIVKKATCLCFRGYRSGMNACVRECVHVQATAVLTDCCIEHRSHLSDCLKLLNKVLFEARVNLQQPETSKIRLETEKALLAVSDDSDLAKCKQTRPSS